jgi:DNA-binding NtrC family response regulator
VAVLADHFLQRAARRDGRPAVRIEPAAVRLLRDYHWPGNVRELRNVLERAAILADGGLIAAEHLALRPLPGAPPAHAAAPAVTPVSDAPPAADLKSAEKAMIEKALRDAQFNKSVAAKKLGITRSQLYVRLKKHGLE